MIPLATLALGACLAVGAASDQILAGDLAPAAPEWSAIAPETPLALAPAPGVQRVFRAAGIAPSGAALEPRLAARSRTLRNPPGRRLRPRPAACRDAPAASRRHASKSSNSAASRRPRAISNSRSAACASPPGGALWIGSVKYGGHTALRALGARQSAGAGCARRRPELRSNLAMPLNARLLRVESREEFPSAGYLATLEEAAGKMARRADRRRVRRCARSGWSPPKRSSVEMPYKSKL